jgi:cytochrome c oxidase subunit IV
VALGHRPHRSSSLVVAIVVGLVGLVFVLQGLGAPIGRSFMIGDLRWTAIGAAMIAAAGLLTWRSLRGSR